MTSAPYLQSASPTPSSAIVLLVVFEVSVFELAILSKLCREVPGEPESEAVDFSQHHCPPKDVWRRCITNLQILYANMHHVDGEHVEAHFSHRNSSHLLIMGVVVWWCTRAKLGK